MGRKFVGSINQEVNQGRSGPEPWPVKTSAGIIIFDGISLPVKWAQINATASGDTTVVNAVPNKKIRVIAITLVADSIVSVSFKSNAGNTIINAMAFAKNGGMDVNRQPAGWFMDTNPGESFIMNLSATANVRGSINYVEYST